MCPWSGTPVEVDFFTKKNIQVGAGQHRHTAQWEPFLKPIYHTVDGGRNPANSPVEATVVYPIIYRVLYIPGGCLGFLKHQQ